MKKFALFLSCVLGVLLLCSCNTSKPTKTSSDTSSTENSTDIVIESPTEVTEDITEFVVPEEFTGFGFAYFQDSNKESPYDHLWSFAVTKIPTTYIDRTEPYIYRLSAYRLLDPGSDINLSTKYISPDSCSEPGVVIYVSPYDDYVEQGFSVEIDQEHFEELVKGFYSLEKTSWTSEDLTQTDANGVVTTIRRPYNLYELGDRTINSNGYSVQEYIYYKVDDTEFQTWYNSVSAYLDTIYDSQN